MFQDRSIVPEPDADGYHVGVAHVVRGNRLHVADEAYGPNVVVVAMRDQDALHPLYAESVARPDQRVPVPVALCRHVLSMGGFDRRPITPGHDSSAPCPASTMILVGPSLTKYTFVPCSVIGPGFGQTMRTTPSATTSSARAAARRAIDLRSSTPLKTGHAKVYRVVLYDALASARRCWMRSRTALANRFGSASSWSTSGVLNASVRRPAAVTAMHCRRLMGGV